MNTEIKTESPSKEELLSKIEEVLTEALSEWDALAKSEPAAAPSEDLSKKEKKEMKKDEDDKDAKDDKDSDKDKDKDKDKDDKDDKKDMKDKKDDDKADKKDMEKSEKVEESDEVLKEMHKSLTAKMEKRGLLAKAESTSAPVVEEKKEVKAEVVVKSEAPAPVVAPDKSEALFKSFDDRFQSLEKNISDLTEIINRIAAQPSTSRKGLAGYAPLHKSESEEPVLSKAETVDQLLTLKKSGRHVDTNLIYRVETGTVTAGDVQHIKKILA